MKRIVIVMSMIFISLFVGYNLQYFRTKEVLLVGEVIGMEIDNAQQLETHNKMAPTSARKIGTVTFIEKETNRFVALGHSATDTFNSNKKELGNKVQGNCYSVDYVGFTKGTKEEMGSINATLDENKKIGYVSANNDYGVFGTLEKIDKEYKTIKTASRYEVRLGEAEIYTSLNEDKPKKYKIEIIGISYLRKNKNIRIRVKDSELIEKTGGIVQGMSGTPVIQNGKLIGAVNYVNIEDPTEAFAIFIDKLIG